MKKKSRQFLETYLNNSSPTGFESSGQKLWLDYIRPWIDDYISDAYGTVVGVVNPKAQYKVVIEAHADEISWFVSYINEKGYISVTQNGGSDPQIAPAKRVNIYTDKGIVPGVFGWPAIHVRDKSNNGAPEVKKESVMGIVRSHFNPEFLNRLDEVVMFDALSMDDLAHIVDLQLALLEKRLAVRRITISVTDAARAWLAETGYDPAYGARPLRRLIQTAIGDPLAKLLIAGEVVDGGAVAVDKGADGLSLTPKT